MRSSWRASSKEGRGEMRHCIYPLGEREPSPSTLDCQQGTRFWNPQGLLSSTRAAISVTVNRGQGLAFIDRNRENPGASCLDLHEKSARPISPGRFRILLDLPMIPRIPFWRLLRLCLVSAEGKELTLWSHPTVAGEGAVD
jgi:hypothetical protein